MSHLTRMARLALAALGVLAIMAAAIACGDDDDDDTAAPASASHGTAPASGGAAGSSVSIGDNVFQPGNLTVKAGTKVTWNWGGKNPHQVVGKFDGKDVTSERQTGTGSFSFTFEKAGTFDYQCGVHGASMAGKITIQ